jgi:uncharacterized protein (TIGR00255 family)
MKSIHSMTGFGTAEGKISGQRFRVEMKALNHRFLDLKVRLPRELQSAEIPARKAIEAHFNRGTLEVKIEKMTDPGAPPQAAQFNLALAQHYYQSLRDLQKALGLQDPLRTVDIATLPEVLGRTDAAAPIEDAWTELEPLIRGACVQLQQMRLTEGQALVKAIEAALSDLEASIQGIRGKRESWEAQSKKRLEERVRAVFEAYALPLGSTVSSGASAQALLESRISQELALLLDRSDIEEELTRFQGHLDHFRKILNDGGPVGRKLDFILQELGREVNTLSNKAQDLGISSEAIQIKVRLEQVREQVMNLE